MIGHAMTFHRLLLTAALVLSWSIPALAQHWGYTGEAGPENWSKIDPKFAMCAHGRNQSPIDLGRFVEADLEPLKVAYKAGASDIVNNGHTVQVNYAPGSALTVDGRVYEDDPRGHTGQRSASYRSHEPRWGMTR